MPAIFLFLFACRIRSRRDECRKSIPQAAGQPNCNDVTESLKCFQSATQSKIDSFSSLATSLERLKLNKTLLPFRFIGFILQFVELRERGPRSLGIVPHRRPKLFLAPSSTSFLNRNAPVIPAIDTKFND